MLKQFLLSWIHGQTRFSMAIVFSMAIEIAGVTGVWTVANCFVRSFDYLGESRLVSLMTENRKLGLRTTSTTEVFQSWSRSLQSYDSFEGFAISEAVIRTETGALAVKTAFVDVGFLKAVGLNPKAGRFFDVYEKGADSIAVVGQLFARSRFGGNQEAIGKTVTDHWCLAF